MKKIVVSFLALIFIFSFSNAQSKKNFGIGIVFGAPAGISMKYWNEPSEAIDIAVGWSLKRSKYYYIHADYLYHNFKLLKPYATKQMLGEFPVYAGIGVRTRFGDGDDEIGVRIPLGVSYLFASLPLDVFGELAPALNLLPDTKMYFEVAIGTRYYF
jgi:hypothetical protein